MKIQLKILLILPVLFFTAPVLAGDVVYLGAGRYGCNGDCGDMKPIIDRLNQTQTVIDGLESRDRERQVGNDYYSPPLPSSNEYFTAPEGAPADDWEPPVPTAAELAERDREMLLWKKAYLKRLNKDLVSKGMKPMTLEQLGKK